jgi:hypothetical protein
VHWCADLDSIWQAELPWRDCFFLAPDIREKPRPALD